MQQVRVWHGAISDVLPVLPGERGGGGGGPAAVGEHPRLRSGAQDQGNAFNRAAFHCLFLSEAGLSPFALSPGVQTGFSAFLSPSRVFGCGPTLSLTTWSLKLVFYSLSEQTHSCK